MGYTKGHLDHLNADGRIPTTAHIDSTQPIWVNADTGISSGMKAAIRAVHSQKRIMPIYDVVETESTGWQQPGIPCRQMGRRHRN